VTNVDSLPGGDDDRCAVVGEKRRRQRSPPLAMDASLRAAGLAAPTTWINAVAISNGQRMGLVRANGFINFGSELGCVFLGLTSGEANVRHVV